MAYQSRSGLVNRFPIIDHESRRSPWTQRDPAPIINCVPHDATPEDIMDPESGASDVSMADGEIGVSPFPINLPYAASKQSLESQEAVSSHLAEMERVENHNIQKHNQLNAKRARMDARIMHERAAQDAKIKAIMDARARRDSRIKQRREREDIAFQRCYDVLEAEETRLRKRLKALKRGLPAEDGASGGRSAFTNFMSPTGPNFSVVPPPAKQHRSSHTSQGEPRAPPRGTESQSYRPPSGRMPHRYYPYPPNGRTSIAYPNLAQPPCQGPATPSDPTGPPDFLPSLHHVPSVSPIPQPSSRFSASSAASREVLPPPRHPSSTFDTRPLTLAPLSSTIGLAAVNYPLSSGFAAVNSGYAKDHASKHHPQSGDQTPSRHSIGDEKLLTGSNSTKKRTPSTTHPYQVSEAFANRHHHCEDTDSLNHGIWTWYGPGGTQERPTAPVTRMYLKCNHDGCGRTDWRTVHGLQCHIVKSHEQPKGTIGSLEKALAAYGVPVKEIEQYEKQHGPGSGGTIADRKNLKIRSKYQESTDKRELDDGESPTSIDLQPAQEQHRQDELSSTNSILQPNASRPDRVNGNAHPVDIPCSAISPINIEQQNQARHLRFVAVNTGWASINATPTNQPVSRDHDIIRRSTLGHILSQGDAPSTEPLKGLSNSFWPSWRAANQTGQPNSLVAGKDRTLLGPIPAPTQHTPISRDNRYVLENDSSTTEDVEMTNPEAEQNAGEPAAKTGRHTETSVTSAGADAEMKYTQQKKPEQVMGDAAMRDEEQYETSGHRNQAEGEVDHGNAPSIVEREDDNSTLPDNKQNVEEKDSNKKQRASHLDDERRRANGIVYEQPIQMTTSDVVRRRIEPKTKTHYENMLHQWKLFNNEYDEDPDPQNAKPAKGFICFFSGGLPTETYIYTAWRWFTAAYSRAHNTSFPKAHQDTKNNDIFYVERESGLKLSKERWLKGSFTYEDFVIGSQGLLGNWHDYPHERYRSSLQLVILAHCNTSSKQTPERRFRQFLHLWARKKHVVEHVIQQKSLRCLHPRCCGFSDLKTVDEFISPMVDSHEISHEDRANRRALKPSALANQARELTFVHVQPKCTPENGPTNHEFRVAICTAEREQTPSLDTVGHLEDASIPSPSILIGTNDTNSTISKVPQRSKKYHGGETLAAEGDATDCFQDKSVSMGLCTTAERECHNGSLIAINVPPVPEEWKQWKRQRLDRRATETSLQRSVKKSEVSKSRQGVGRGRPKRSQNKKTLLEQRRATVIRENLEGHTYGYL